MGLSCRFLFFKFPPVHILHPSSCFHADNHMLSVTFLRSLWMDRFVFVGGVVCCRRGWANYKAAISRFCVTAFRGGTLTHSGSLTTACDEKIAHKHARMQPARQKHML